MKNNPKSIKDRMISVDKQKKEYYKKVREIETKQKLLDEKIAHAVKKLDEVMIDKAKDENETVFELEIHKDNAESIYSELKKIMEEREKLLKDMKGRWRNIKPPKFKYKSDNYAGYMELKKLYIEKTRRCAVYFERLNQEKEKIKIYNRNHLLNTSKAEESMQKLYVLIEEMRKKKKEYEEAKRENEKCFLKKKEELERLEKEYEKLAEDVKIAANEKEMVLKRNDYPV